MGAYRCSTCSINYGGYSKGKCLACTGDVWWDSTGTPDEDAMVKAYEASGGDLNADAFACSTTTPLPIPNVDADITYHADQDWIPHQVLIDHGYRCLENFQIVRIRNRFYELQAHIGRTLVHGVTGGAWWIEQVEPDKYDVGCPVLSADAYSDLEESRGATPL